MNKISGVYKITNTITGDFYIGSSINIKQRWGIHKSPASHHQQPEMKLYQDMDKYGKDKFTFEIIEETTVLREREQYWIDELKPAYNTRRAKGLDTTKVKAHQKAYEKERCSRLCQFEGKILTFNALKKRLQRRGIAHPNQEAKKYLLHSN